MVSWMPPPYSPSNYNVSYSCQSSSSMQLIRISYITHYLAVSPQWELYCLVQSLAAVVLCQCALCSWWLESVQSTHVCLLPTPQCPQWRCHAVAQSVIQWWVLLWSGQGTVPHCTVSNLLSTDVLVSPSGAPVGAARRGDMEIFWAFTFTTLCCGLWQ